MRIFRTLYAKIFDWFWLTLTVGYQLGKIKAPAGRSVSRSRMF